MNRTRIEWVKNDDGSQGDTWNPITGCRHGCSYCYARRIAERFGPDKATERVWRLEEMGPVPTYLDAAKLEELLSRSLRCHDLLQPRTDFLTDHTTAFPFRFDPTFHRYRLLEPQSRRKRATIFVCSMADLLGDWVPREWVVAVLDTLKATPQHRYLLLTKNPRRYADFDWPENCWLGTTCEDQAAADERIPHLLATPAAHRFVSLEPLLGPVDLGLFLPPETTPEMLAPGARCGHHGTLLRGKPCPVCFPACLDWVIAGQQTGPSAKQPDPAWVDSLIDQCRAAKVPVFAKNNLHMAMPPQEVPWL